MNKVFTLIGIFVFNFSVIANHPSLFFDMDDIESLKAKIQTDTWIKDAYEVLKTHVDGTYMKVSTAPYPYSGPYNGMGTIGRALEKKVGGLAFVGYMTGDRKYFDKAIDMVLSAAAQSDPDEKEFWRTHLQVGDGARAYAIAYDWLYPFMDDNQRKLLKEEVYKFGKELFEDNTTWGKSDPGVSSCNHNAVHFGGLGLCALIVGDKPEWESRAVGRIRDYLKYAMDETGYFTEGHNYANYGLQGTLSFTYPYQRKTGIDLVGEQPRLELMTNQFSWQLLPWGSNFLALNDNGEPLSHAALLIYPITRYGNSQALWCWLRAVGNDGDKTFGTGRNKYEGNGMCIPYAIIWANPDLKPYNPVKGSWKLSHKFESGRVFMRDDWLDPMGTLVSFTSGIDFHRGHNHQDENSFTFFAKGEEFAIDPGYTPKLTSDHNTLLVDGVGQIGHSAGRITCYKDYGDYVYVAGQSPEAYQWPDVLVGHFQRQLVFVRHSTPYILIADSIQVEPDTPATYQWLLNTNKNNDIEIMDGKAKIIGANNGNICDVFFLNPSNGVFGEVDLSQKASKRSPRDTTSYKPADFYRQICFESTAHNPYFVTLLAARESNEQPPKVEISENGNGWNVSIDFADGITHRLNISEFGIEFTNK